MIEVPFHYSRLVVRSIDLPSIASFHAFLHRGFEGGVRDFLFRADRGLASHGRFNIVTLLVQSEGQPDWSRIPEILEYKSNFFAWRVQQGDVFRFFLRGNTARRRARSEEVAAAKAEGPFRPLKKHWIAARSHEDRVAWLRENATRRGFELVGDPLTARTEDRIASSSSGHSVPIYNCDFEGHLRVLDEHAFVDALRRGVGHQRVYGCGLLSVARRA